VFEVKPTGFGHMGLFPEHTCHWAWIKEQIRACGAGCRVLNLFAYTGAMSLACAAAGAEVCHVDAVRDVNEWARRNAAASGLGAAPIRWITDDAMKFVAREIRRGRRYDGIVLDPPSYGKGPQGEKWILEEEMLNMLNLLMQVTSESPRFVLFTCHTLGFSPPLMRNLLLPWADRHGGKIDAGTMTIASPHCPWVLPSGFYARWAAGDAGKRRQTVLGL
jgi:23S rRNA (cytosine1962-C5)-methyltransferase